MGRNGVRIARSDADLRKASAAVDFDFSMMGATLYALLQSDVDQNSPPSEHCISNSLLHAFLIATRNLCHFLYSHKARSADIIAEDFFDDPCDWHRVRPPLPAEFTDGSLVDRISKRLAHLTWERASGTKPIWGTFRIAWELSKSLEVFVAHVNSLRLSDEIAEDVAAQLGMMRDRVQEYGSVEVVESVPPSKLFREEDFWTDPQEVAES